MRYLLDTNVLSETRKPRPDPGAVAWLRSKERAALHISVLTLGEITRGSSAIARRDPVAGASLVNWLEGLRLLYMDRVVPVDAPIAEAWGRMSADRPRPIVDTLLAATALVHDMTLVTRNLRDFADTGVTLLNPWEAE